MEWNRIAVILAGFDTVLVRPRHATGCRPLVTTSRTELEKIAAAGICSIEFLP